MPETYPLASDPVTAFHTTATTTERHGQMHGRVIEIGENAKAWRARGDGVSDDTQYLQDWIDATVGTKVSPWTDNGGLGILPGGVYCISDTLNVGEHTGIVQNGISNSVKLQGAGGALGTASSNSKGATWLKWIGASGGGPMMTVHNTHATTIEGINFDGNDLADTGLKITHSTNDQNPHCILVASCQFRRAQTFNTLVGSTTVGDEANADVCNLTFFRCKWDNGAAIDTRTHFRGAAGEALPVNFVGCEWVGNHQDLGTVSHHLELTGGTYHVFGGLMGGSNVSAVLYNVNPIDGVNSVPPNLTVHGLESQGDRMFLKWDYSTSRSSAAGQRPTVLVGVTIGSDAYGGFTRDDDDIEWDATGWDPLIITGCRLVGNLNVISTTAIVFVQGLMFTDASGSIIGQTTRVAGMWYDGSGGGTDPKWKAQTPGAMKVYAAASGARWSAVIVGAGAMAYDTTLAKPIFSDGTVWRDAAGTAV